MTPPFPLPFLHHNRAAKPPHKPQVLQPFVSGETILNNGSSSPAIVLCSSSAGPLLATIQTCTRVECFALESHRAPLSRSDRHRQDLPNIGATVFCRTPAKVITGDIELCCSCRHSARASLRQAMVVTTHLVDNAEIVLVPTSWDSHKTARSHTTGRHTYRAL